MAGVTYSGRFQPSSAMAPLRAGIKKPLTFLRDAYHGQVIFFPIHAGNDKEADRSDTSYSLEAPPKITATERFDIIGSLLYNK